MAAIDLIVLGMIKKKPQSAYELQKNVEYRNISRWVKISTPSIYKKVIQLEEKGYLQSALHKDGKMPEKAIYTITEAGEKYFLYLMEENAGNMVNVFLDFNAVIMNLGLVSDDLKGILLDRIGNSIEDMRSALEANQQRKRDVPLIGKSIMEQQYEIALTLQKWLENFTEEYLGENHE